MAWRSKHSKPNSKARSPLYDVALLRYTDDLPEGYEEGDSVERTSQVVVERECKYDEKRGVFIQVDTGEEFEKESIFQWRFHKPDSSHNVKRGV